MFERYIAMTIGCYGYFGMGDTADEAKKKLRSAARKYIGNGSKPKPVINVWKFTSELPFTPITKKVADETEADCWVGQDGSMSWIRCERELIETPAPAAAKEKV